MKKSRISEAGSPFATDDGLQTRSSEFIPVLLIFALCLLAVSIFPGKFHLLQEYFAPTTSVTNEKFIWISGSAKFKEGLYLLDPEQIKENIPELVFFEAQKTFTPGLNAEVLSIRYESNSPNAVNLPPAIANIFYQPISINRADKDILSTLPGIGPVLAEKILREREVLGQFRSKDELLRIKGIGPKKLARLDKYIVLD